MESIIGDQKNHTKINIITLTKMLTHIIYVYVLIILLKQWVFYGYFMDLPCSLKKRRKGLGGQVEIHFCDNFYYQVKNYNIYNICWVWKLCFIHLSWEETSSVPSGYFIKSPHVCPCWKQWVLWTLGRGCLSTYFYWLCMSSPKQQRDS